MPWLLDFVHFSIKIILKYTETVGDDAEINVKYTQQNVYENPFVRMKWEPMNKML